MNLTFLLEDFISETEILFFEGKVENLKNRFCPKCNGKILYSMGTRPIDLSRPPGSRLKGSLSIYCVGLCQTMLSHLDGYCPAWAENITDWEDFSSRLFTLSEKSG
jgi:hypothetical protein